MKQKLLIFFLSMLTTSIAQAVYFVGFSGARLNLDYSNVLSGLAAGQVTGQIELAGINFGTTTISPGNFGKEFSIGFFGTNSENLDPIPDWGITWYYRLAAKFNYTFSFKLFFFVGTDLLASFYQDGASRYMGVGFLYGMGYKINDNANLSLSATNSSILFAGVNYRTLRGHMLEINYTFK